MIAQLCIACTGACAIWLSQDSRPHWRRYACIFGLLGQPFWVWSAWQAQQWGILALTFVYAYSWARGFRLHWLRSAQHRIEDCR